MSASTPLSASMYKAFSQEEQQDQGLVDAAGGKKVVRGVVPTGERAAALTRG
jgi:hypothetical protein